VIRDIVRATGEGRLSTRGDSETIATSVGKQGTRREGHAYLPRKISVKSMTLAKQSPKATVPSGDDDQARRTLLG
jgi:hypothetical protein